MYIIDKKKTKKILIRLIIIIYRNVYNSATIDGDVQE